MKCPVPDKIPAEFLQRLGQGGIENMTTLMHKIYRTEEIPDEFLKCVSIPNRNMQ